MHTETEQFKAPPKTQRIATRVTNEHKSLFEQAASLRGLSLTDFMVNAAFDAAVRTLHDGEMILRLGPEDTKLLAEAVLRPVIDPETEYPNLYRAFQEFNNES